MYWPKEGTELYGPIQVELLDQRELATYTIRKMLIKHIKVKHKHRHILHKHLNVRDVLEISTSSR